MKTTTAILALLLITQTSYSQNKAQDTPKIINLTPKQAEESFQKNADIVRLQHLKYWVELIETYHTKTGKYPFQGELNTPIYVEIATPHQKSYINQKPPKPAIVKPMAEFVAVLEKGLGKTINEYYDPQYVPNFRPNFYLYMIDGDQYNFAIHTHQSYPFSKFIAQNYYKVEVSNIPNYSANLVIASKVLFENDDFKNVIGQKLQKADFFKQREQENLHATKHNP